MTTNPTHAADPADILHALRGLSHDLGAAHMMLEHSFGRLKSLLAERPPADAPEAEVDSQLAQVEACMHASKGYLDDVLRLSTSGAAELEPEPVAVAQILDRVLVEQGPLLQQRGVEVRVLGPLPVVWCHPDRLRQVLTNLVRNAALHGCDLKRPKIIVHSCLGPDADDSMTSIRVYDNGPGIDPRRHREVFLPGRRLAETEAAGSGWGLPTARRIAERFGGSLVLDTNCKSGTAFVLTLPDAAEAVDQARAPATVEPGREWRLQLDGRHQGPLRHNHGQHAPQLR